MGARSFASLLEIRASKVFGVGKLVCGIRSVFTPDVCRAGTGRHGGTAIEQVGRLFGGRRFSRLSDGKRGRSARLEESVQGWLISAGAVVHIHHFSHIRTPEIEFMLKYQQ